MTEKRHHDREEQRPRALNFSVYHSKGGPDSAVRIRIRPRDAGDALPTTQELKDLILVRLGKLEEEDVSASSDDPSAQRRAQSWHLRNVSQGSFVPEVDDTGEVIADGDVIELMDRSMAGRRRS